MKTTHLYRLILLFLFVLTGFTGSAQDLIIKKNGDKVYCDVVEEDSLTIYYLRHPQKTIFELKKTEVESVYLSQSLKSKRQKRETSADSREKKELLSFMFSGGSAFPIGAFGNNDVTNTKAGFAKNGGMFRASANVKLSKYVGVIVSVHYQTHQFDTDLFDQQENAFNPGFTFKTTSTNWKLSGICAGLNFSFPFRENSKCFLDLNVSEGFAACTIPGLQTTVSFNGQTVIAIQSRPTTWTPSLLAGLGFHYMITNTLGINFGTNFFAARPVYIGLQSYTSTGNASVVDVVQKITTLNAYLGLTVSAF